MTEPTRRAPLSADLLPASGAWRPGDPVGDRQFLTVADGAPVPARGRRPAPRRHRRLRDLGRARRRRPPTPCWCATPSPATPTPPVAAGPGHPTAGWWDALIGPGRPLDTDRLLRGVRRTCSAAARAPPARRRSTRPPARRTARRSRWSPSATWSAAQAAARRPPRHRPLARRRRRLDGRHAGRSSGAVMYPDRVRALVRHRHHGGGQRPADRLVAASAAHADRARPEVARAATTTTPRRATGPHRGLALARQIAQVTYRSDEVFNERFGRDAARPARRPLQPLAALRRRGLPRLPRRQAGPALRRQQLPASSTKAMDLHDIGRGRGGVERGAGPHRGARCSPCAIDSDALYPPYQQQRIRDAAASPAATPRPRRHRQPARPRRLPASRPTQVGAAAGRRSSTEIEKDDR